MKDTEKAGIRQISSFVNGIQRDMDAVKKAIELDHNNGLAEGSDNKLKVVKQPVPRRRQHRQIQR